jgi:hypothetical protein
LCDFQYHFPFGIATYSRAKDSTNLCLSALLTLSTFGLAFGYYHHFKLYHDLQGQNFLQQLPAGSSFQDS